MLRIREKVTMITRKRTLSFLMCYVFLATTLYVVSLWLASDIHIKQVLTVESRQVIIQNSGNSVERGQSEVVVKTKTNGQVQSQIIKEAKTKHEVRSPPQGPKYSLKVMTALKKMQEISEKIKGEHRTKNDSKVTKTAPGKQGKSNPKASKKDEKGGKKEVKGVKQEHGKNNKSKVTIDKNKAKVDKRNQGKNDKKSSGNNKKNSKGEKQDKKGDKNGSKKDHPDSHTKPPTPPKPKKQGPPVPELIYGLFRKPRLDNLDTSVQIPHIVHQTWKETLLPLSLKPYLQSWKKYNPTWEYWFWTDADARLLVQTRFPDLLGMYDKFEKAVQRADVIRYFILYEFGGVYADLDVEALKPLDNFTKPHHCIISNEPLLHTYLIWKKDRLPCNAFMASIPKHPFFKFLITRLPVYDRRTKRSEVMLKTGPLMLDVAMGEYERSYVKHEKDINAGDKCYLAPPEEAMPSFDPSARGWFIFTCRRKQRVPEKRRYVCDDLIKRKFQDVPVPKTAYANHRWMHSWSPSHKPFDRKYRPKLTSSIHNIVDNVTLPSDKILDPTMETNPDES
jgi:hypothetical protein